jgi:hypothetical protein
MLTGFHIVFIYVISVSVGTIFAHKHIKMWIMVEEKVLKEDLEL